tara:strand:- start:5301 stop:6212 length:912 start_codon:yes stop_codon:yes gene_type:complete
MACTAPINIVKNTKNICDNKCNYSFLYPMTNLAVTNKTKYIKFKCDKTEMQPVTFNAGKYNVDDFRIYAPSLHTYGNVSTIGELVISHTDNTSGKQLLVCIPIKTGVSAMGNAQILDMLVDKIAKDAPATGDKTNIQMSTFTLNNIVPYKPFYSYKGSLLYASSLCSKQDVDYVVFKPEDAILLSTRTHEKLKKVVSPSGITTKTNSTGLFYNKTGPTKDLGDGIYIECAPTGYSGETNVEVEPSESDLNLGYHIQNILSNYFVTFLIGIVLMAIILKIGDFAFYKIFGSKSQGTTPASSTAL